MRDVSSLALVCLMNIGNTVGEERGLGSEAPFAVVEHPHTPDNPSTHYLKQEGYCRAIRALQKSWSIWPIFWERLVKSRTGPLAEYGTLLNRICELAEKFYIFQRIVW